MNTRAGAEVNLTSDEIPAVIISHGKKDFGAPSTTGAARVKSGSWAGDEEENETEFDAVFAR